MSDTATILDYILDYWQRLQAVPLTPAAQAGYTALLYYLNRNNRRQPFGVSNLQLCEMANISPGSIHKVKMELIEKGYISVEKGRGKKAPFYTCFLGSSKQSSNYSSKQSSKQSSNYSSTSKENKSKENYIYIPTLEEVKAYIEAHHYRVNAEAFYNHYQSLGWVNVYGVPIRDWHSTLRVWHLKNDKATDEDIKKLNRKKQEAHDLEYNQEWKNTASKYDAFFKE